MSIKVLEKAEKKLEQAKKALLQMIRVKNSAGRWQFKKLRFKVWTVGRYGRPVVTA